MAINLASYSWHPTRPCFLLKWSNVSVLVDCPLDFSSLNSFLPHIYSPTAYPVADFEIDYIRRVRDNFLIEGIPEVHPTPLHTLQIESIDCILISHWNSLIALPFYVHETGFRGRIYTTTAVIQFGKLMIQELIEYWERIAIDEADSTWKNPDVYSRFPNPPFRNPVEWKKFYSKEVMESVLATIVPLSFQQSFVTVENMIITPYCSGYQIGSCNWIINTDRFKIGCVGSTSNKSTHVKQDQLDRFKDLDVMILSSLSCSPDGDPSSNAIKVREITMETLKAGGNVLIPVLPTGFVFDAVELIIRSIDQTNGVPLDTPVYFISPVAKAAVAFANVNAEWLSEDRQKNIYDGAIPEEPFLHSTYIKTNRLKIYDNLFEPFSKEIKTPCVMFCGHPSLRIGDAAHMLHLWGNDNKNALIMTNPDYPLNEVYGPYEDLKIRAYYYPVDTRLTFSDINQRLADLKPKSVYVPDQYLIPYIPGKTDTCVTYNSCTPMTYDETLLVTNKKPKKRKINVHPDIVKTLHATPHPSNPGYSVCPLNGYLSAFDDEYELKPATSLIGSLKPTYVGVLTPELFSARLKEKKHNTVWENNCDGSVTVKIPSMKAQVTIGNDGLRTKVQNFMADKLIYVIFHKNKKLLKYNPSLEFLREYNLYQLVRHKILNKIDIKKISKVELFERRAHWASSEYRQLLTDLVTSTLQRLC